MVDFAGSDSPYADADKPAEPILYFPILLSPITVSYNLSGVDKLQLSAGHDRGDLPRQITTWNDPAIAADNPGVTLPDTSHHGGPPLRRLGHDAELHRVAGGRGARRTWTLKSRLDGRVAGDTQAGNGNQGVAQIVTSTDGAIGYVDSPTRSRRS